MEHLVVFEAKQGPDPLLDHLAGGLRSRGYSVEAGQRYDLVVHKGPVRGFVGLGPHPEGLAARIKTKGLIPGRSSDLLDEIVELLAQRLGTPTDRTDEIEEAHR